LRYHAERRALECHQCGHSGRPPRQCPRCDGTVFAPKGPGSEWIQAEIAKLLPSIPAYRYDRDRKDNISPMQHGEPGIIVGTTAALGLAAPPNLALVTLTFADTFATHPDFRSGERYHALVRRILEWHPDRAPLLLVQTFTGKHPVLRDVIAGHDSAHYPGSELELRRGHGYPPFAQFAQVQVAHRNSNDGKRVALELAALLRDRGAQPTELLGPAPAPVARLKGLYAHNLLVRAETLERLIHLLEPVKRARGGARIRVDVSPRDLSELMD
jgi:primosomal protein N' (replication factor Y)